MTTVNPNYQVLSTPSATLVDIDGRTGTTVDMRINARLMKHQPIYIRYEYNYYGYVCNRYWGFSPDECHSTLQGDDNDNND